MFQLLGDSVRRPAAGASPLGPGPHWGLPSPDPLIWPTTPPSRSAPGHGHLVNTLARQSLIANGNSLPLKVGVITFTWPTDKVFGPIRIFRMAETVRYKFGTRVFAYGRIQNNDKKNGAPHYPFSILRPLCILTSECSCYTARQLAAAQCIVIGPVCNGQAGGRAGGQCPNLTTASARAVFASLWALFLFCRRMCCRYAAVAFQIFCIHIWRSDAILLQADSCPSVSFPSHGRVHWRSEMRTALHIQHREVWIDLDCEGIDQLPRFPNLSFIHNFRFIEFWRGPFRLTCANSLLIERFFSSWNASFVWPSAVNSHLLVLCYAP